MKKLASLGFNSKTTDELDGHVKAFYKGTMSTFNADARDMNFAVTDLDKRSDSDMMKKDMGLFNDELRDLRNANRGYTRMMVLKDAVGAGEQRFRTGMYNQFDIEGNTADYCFDWWRKDSTFSYGDVAAPKEAAAAEDAAVLDKRRLRRQRRQRRRARWRRWTRFCRHWTRWRRRWARERRLRGRRQQPRR